MGRRMGIPRWLDRG